MTFSFVSLLRAMLIYPALAMSIAGCQQRDSTPKGDSSHSHNHNHEHHHGEPQFGGRIVEIGHTHNPDGLTFYLAEILPEKNKTIRLHVSAENENSDSTAVAMEASPIAAYVTDPEGDSIFSKEIIFATSKGNSDVPATLWSADIPDDLLDRKQLSLVIPKVVLGGERLSFSFTIKRDPTLSAPEAEAGQELETETDDEPTENKKPDEADPPTPGPAVNKNEVPTNPENSQ
jgi:hypothetical protein